MALGDDPCFGVPRVLVYVHRIAWQSPRFEPGTELIARLRFPTPTMNHFGLARLSQ